MSAILRLLSQKKKRRDQKKNSKRNSYINELPLELLEIILEKTYLLNTILSSELLKVIATTPMHIQRLSYFLKRKDAAEVIGPSKDKVIFLKLASIDSNWSILVRGGKFKNTIMPHLRVFYTRYGALRNNLNYLLLNIKADQQFIEELRITNCLTAKQAESLKRLSNDRERILQILRTLKFCYERVFTSFVRSLRSTNQHSVARIVSENGVVAEINVVNENIRNLRLQEHYLVADINGLRDTHSIKPVQVQEINYLRANDLEILRVHQTKKGIALFFWCHSQNALDWIQAAEKTGNLLEKMTSCFKQFNTNITPKYIRPMLVKFTKPALENIFRKKSSINDLPWELLDLILEKVYLICTIISPKESKLITATYTLQEFPIRNDPAVISDKEIILKLESVNRIWSLRVIRRKFKRCILRRLLAFHKNELARVETIRKNRNYLLMSIRSDPPFIEKLLSAGCLTDKQAESLNRLPRERDRNFEILRDVNFHDENVFNSFIQCLRLTRQHSVVRILSHEGVVIGIDVLNEKIWNLKLKEHDLVIDINALRDSHSIRPRHVQEILDCLRAENLEILQVHQTRKGIALFMWCKSEKALKWIQTAQESGDFLKMLTRLLKQFNTTITPKRISIGVNFNIRNFERLVPAAKFTTTLPVKSHWIVHGVTKLRNEIYVLCSRFSSSTILVFPDQSPFRPCRNIDVDQIVNPFLRLRYIGESGQKRNEMDIAANVRNNCLYVYDNSLHIVLRIEKGTGNDCNIIPWLSIKLSSPRTLSVSKEGLLLLFSHPVSCYHMNFYESNASLVNSIQLPDVIVHPRRAVETSKGNFMIIHKMRTEETYTISEVSGDTGTILSQFTPSHATQELLNPYYLSVDSFDWLFVSDKFQIIFLNPNLRWNRILIPTKEDLKEEQRETLESIEYKTPYMVYDDEKEQLIVSNFWSVRVYSLDFENSNT